MINEPLLIYVPLMEAEEVYINKIGCLRYKLGPCDSPVESTIDNDYSGYEVAEYKDGRVVLRKKKYL